MARKATNLESTYTRLLLLELILLLVRKGVLTKVEALGMHDKVDTEMKERGL
jgi:hypothetical protein